MTKGKQPRVEVIQFSAQVWSIKTLADGGINVTLTLSDKSIAQVSQLLECKRLNVILEVAAIPLNPEPIKKAQNAESTETRKRTKRHPYRSK